MTTAFLDIAQRGGRGLFPENSLAAFDNAMRLGCDGAELGVRLTKDGQVVVHDGERLCAERCRRSDGGWLSSAEVRNIRGSTYEQLCRYDIGRPKPASPYAKQFPFVRAIDGARVPLLSEVIQLARTASERFLLVIDLKARVEHAAERPWIALVDSVLEILHRHDFLGRAVLTSYDWGSLVYAKRVVPGVRTWCSTLPMSWFRPGNPPAAHSPPSAKYRELLKSLDATGGAPWYAGFDPRQFGMDASAAVCAAGGNGWLLHVSDFGPSVALAANRQGIPVIVWSESRSDALARRRLLAAGAGGLCSDYPDADLMTADVDAAQVLEQAAAAFRCKNWPEAISSYRYVVDHFPCLAPLDAFLKLAASQRMARDLRASRATLDTCLIAYPDNPAARVELALLCMRGGDWEGALAVWRDLLGSGTLRAHKTNQYNRAARSCEVLQQWDLHASIVTEGLSKFPGDKDLSERQTYGAAQASLRRGAWGEAISLFESLAIPESWPFALSYYSKQAEIERALAQVATDGERTEVLRLSQQSRTSVPRPYELAGMPNAVQLGRRNAPADEKLVEALLGVVEAAKSLDVNFKEMRDAWMEERVAAVARVAAPDAIRSLVLPAPYFRTFCRILLRFGHFRPYWSFRERFVEQLESRRSDAPASLSRLDLADQILLANELGDHDYFARLTSAASAAIAALPTDERLVIELSRVYHRRLPLDWPLSLGDSERRFSELVSGKSIAIVGPVASEEHCGEEIDGFDRVVRFNHRSSLTYDPAKFGRRTSMSWYIRSALQASSPSDFIQAMNRLDFVVVDQWSRAEAPWLSQVASPIRGRLECRSEGSNPLLFGNPTGVQRVLLDLARFGVGRIKVFCSNLFLDPQYDGGYRAPQKNVCPAFCLHDPVSNFLLLKRARELGMIETDDRLGQILALSAEQYVAKLDARYGVHLDA